MPINAPISCAVDIALPTAPARLDDKKVQQEIDLLYQAVKNLQAALSPIALSKVVQVVSAVYQTSVVCADSATYIDSGLTASITPKSASNKILVIVHQALSPTVVTGVGDFGKARTLRAAVTVHEDQRITGGYVYAHSVYGHSTLDSPNSTASVTYKVQFASDGTVGATMEAQHANLRPSTITLLEVLP